MIRSQGLSRRRRMRESKRFRGMHFFQKSGNIRRIKNNYGKGIDMKTVKKKWGKIVGIVLAVIMLICLITSGLFYWRVKSSILGEMGIRHVFEIEKVVLAQGDRVALERLDERDQRKLFIILSHTRKYDKSRDKPYLLDGSFLYGPGIFFANKPGQRGDLISWEYHEGIMEYMYPGLPIKHSGKYYLDQKYAQELRVLFDKYTLPYEG